MNVQKWPILVIQLIAYTALLLHAFVPHHHHEQTVYFQHQDCPHHANEESRSSATDLLCQTLEHAWQINSSSVSIEDVWLDSIRLDVVFYSFLSYEDRCFTYLGDRPFKPWFIKTFQSKISQSIILRGPPALPASVV